MVAISEDSSPSTRHFGSTLHWSDLIILDVREHSPVSSSDAHPLSAELSDGISEAVTWPLSADARAAVVCRLARKTYESMVWSTVRTMSVKS